MQQFVFISLLLLAQLVAQPGSAQLFGSRSSRAYEQLEKGNYDKVLDLISKELEKDSSVVEAYYVRSLYYLDEDNPEADHVKAYNNISRAIELFNKASDEKKTELADFPVTPDLLVETKDEADQQGYDMAAEQDTEEAYDAFLQLHETAAQRPKAILRRDELAFARHEQLGTWQAYLAFTQDFPYARQKEEATKRYEKLLYEDKTAAGTLAQYRAFVKDHPENPYVKEAEAMIYALATVRHTPESYVAYLQSDHPRRYERQALNALYHMMRDRGQAEQFLEQYAGRPGVDSIARVQFVDDLVLAPFYDASNRTYGFISSQGSPVIQSQFGTLQAYYLCGGITSDVLWVRNQEAALVNRRGDTFWTWAPMQEVRYLGDGILMALGEKEVQLVHKPGRLIYQGAARGVQLLAGYIKYCEGGTCGLISASGKEVLPKKYASIDLLEGAVLALERADGTVSLLSANEVEVAIQQNRDALEALNVDEVDLSLPGHLWVASGDQEGIVNLALGEVLPLQAGTIRELDGAYLVENSAGHLLYGANGSPLSAKAGTDSESLGSWVILRSPGGDSAYNTVAPENPIQADSMRLLGKHFLLGRSAQGQTVIYSALGLELAVPEQTEVRLVQPPQGSQLVDEYIQLTDDQETAIYSPQLIEVIRGAYGEASQVAEGLLALEQATKTGKLLVSATGDLLVDTPHDSYAARDGRTIVTQQGNKFGLYHLATGTLLPADYEAPPAMYSDTVVLAKEGEGLGLVGLSGQPLTQFAFQQVQHWSDSLALVQPVGDKFWQVLAIGSGEVGLNKIGYFYAPFGPEGSDTKYAIFFARTRWGVMKNTGEVIIDNKHDIIKNLGSADRPLFFCGQQQGPDAEPLGYQVKYIGPAGNPLIEASYSVRDFDILICKE